MKTLFNWICFLSLLVLIIMAASCSTTKKSQSHEVTDKNEVNEAILDSNRVYRSEIDRLTSELRESQFGTAVFDSTKCPDIKMPDCPSMLNADSVNRLIRDLNNALSGANNKVKRFADGSVELQGRIKSVSYSAEKNSKTVMEKERVIDSLTKKIAEKNTVIEHTDIQKASSTKRSFFSQWYIWLVFLVLGYSIAKRKQILSWARR